MTAPRHLLTTADLSGAEIHDLLDRAAAIKAAPSRYVRALYERTLLMIFEAPSLRTRLSFETAMTQLHGHAIAFYTVHSPWGVGKESIGDVARTVSRYCDAVTARLYDHGELEGLAADASVPVISAMTNEDHPCQVLADLLTIRERCGRLEGVRLAYLGDARNNVTYGLLRAGIRVGMEVRIGCPDDPAFLPEARVLAEGAAPAILHDAVGAVRGADVVYTDSWMSYRIPSDRKAERVRALAPFRVDTAVMAASAPGAVFLHCLPAMRGDEVAAEVIDGARSAVFDQAENRLHVQKAVLLDRVPAP